MAVNWWNIPTELQSNFASDIGERRLPVITRDMLQWNPPSGEMVYPMGDNQQPYWQETPGYWDFTPEAKQQLNASGVQWSGAPNNIEWQFWGGDETTGPTNASLKLKTGDRMSMNLDYNMQDGALAPNPRTARDEYWNTRDLSWGDVGRGIAFVGTSLGTAWAAAELAPLIAAELGVSAPVVEAAMIESGMVGTAGAAMEYATVPGLEAFINGTIGAAEFVGMNPTFATELASGNTIANSTNPLGEWPGADSNLGLPEYTQPPPAYENPLGDWPTSPPPGGPPPAPTTTTPPPPAPTTTTPPPPVPPTTPKGPNAIVKAVMDTLGIGESAATLLVTSVPAIASLFSDHDPQTTTNTSGTPQQVAVKNQIADATAARLPEYMQRDRQRADQQMAWGNAAALVPQNYTLPAQVAAPGMVGPTFGANGTGMMGTYRPRGVMGLYG